MATDLGRRDFWQAQIDAWRESGMTQRVYCRRHELPETQFSHWKHRLQKAHRRPSAKTRLVPLTVIEQTSSGPGDVDGRGLVDCDGRGELTLVLGSGLRLEIGDGFNGATLRRVLEVLGDVG